MQESIERKSKEHDSEPDAAIADAEATSKETLSDVEENQKNFESGSSDSDPGPSPDGAFDESDETKDAGPM
jgi:hypothetical protein